MKGSLKVAPVRVFPHLVFVASDGPSLTKGSVEAVAQKDAGGAAKDTEPPQWVQAQAPVSPQVSTRELLPTWHVSRELQHELFRLLKSARNK